MPREIGETVLDDVLKYTGRFSRPPLPATFNERESPAKAALRAGTTLDEAAVTERIHDLVVEEITADDAIAFLRYLAANAWLQDIFFHWRPFLPDPDDDMILELAFAANCAFIVTHNIRHFAGCEQMGVQAVTPRDFLQIIRKRHQP